MFERHIFALAASHGGSSSQPGRVASLAMPRTAAGLAVHGLFSEALLEQSPTRQHRNALDWTLSFAVHFVVLSALLLLPLLLTNTLDLHQFQLTFLAAPGVPAAPAPPPPAGNAGSRPAKAAPQSVIVSGKLMTPAFIPRAIATTAAPPDLSSEAVLGGVVGGVPGGLPGGVLGGVIGGLLGGTSTPPPPPAPRAAKPASPTRAPVRVGGNIKPPRLLYQPPFLYPELARQARIEGDVSIDAIIDEHGSITEARVVRGNPMLIASALQSVLGRKYEPTYLDGQPVSLELEVTIHYKLN
jgi:periplasmic protein TonB